MNHFKRRGIRIHDPNAITGDSLAEKAGLPASPFNIKEALGADIQEPDEGPDVRNSLRKYGGNPNA